MIIPKRTFLNNNYIHKFGTQAIFFSSNKSDVIMNQIIKFNMNQIMRSTFAVRETASLGQQMLNFFFLENLLRTDASVRILSNQSTAIQTGSGCYSAINIERFGSVFSFICTSYRHVSAGGGLCFLRTSFRIHVTVWKHPCKTQETSCA